MAARILRNMRGLLTLSGCVLNTLVLIGPLLIFAIVKLLVPVKAVRNLMNNWIMLIGESWVAVNIRLFSWSNSTTWDIRLPDDLGKNRWYFILPNHQTWVDIIVLQTALNRKIPFLKFFLKQELIWFPFLGLAWWAMDMPFMKRYSKSYLAKYPHKKGKDLEATRKSCEKFRHIPTSVINFVEGTRFTPEKKEKCASKFDNLLPPRAGGVALAMTSMGSMFDAILDVTIVYPHGPAKFWDMLCGDFKHVIIEIEKRPVEAWIVAGDYQNDRVYRRKFHHWLAEIWQEKDARINFLLDKGNQVSSGLCKNTISKTLMK